jgi:signal peptidase I
VDKRENYIKRVAGLPGDTIRISGGILYVNGLMEEKNGTMQYDYFVQTDGSLIEDDLFNEMGYPFRTGNSIPAGHYMNFRLLKSLLAK